NLGGLIGPHAPEGSGVGSDGEGMTDGEDEVKSAGAGDRPWLGAHVSHGLKPGDTVPLRRVKEVYASAFACDHTVPCLGYLFSSVSHKLKPEYVGLPGREIKRLREPGDEITAPSWTPFLAF